jgi:hypothetical protein
LLACASVKSVLVCVQPWRLRFASSEISVIV